MFREIAEEGWVEQYRPIQNHIVGNASFGGCMFETYGDEQVFVKAQDPHHIWTYGDGDDGGTYVWNGYHIVNRIGYFITEVPWQENEEIQVCIIDPIEEEEYELDTTGSI